MKLDTKSDNNDNNCGCQEIKKYTPIRIYNPPGLSYLSYRAGTHAVFKSSMINAIATEPALEKLTTRSDDDLFIALLDSWATVADVLTFYQERIANEGFLRTSSERRSVLELARSIGYELRPGVAASTFLAFTMENSPGVGEKAIIGIGTKVQSIPAQDQMPQIFETVEKIEARHDWNSIKPLTKKKQDVYESLQTRQVFINGVSTRLKPGDGLLFVIAGEPVAFRIINEIEVDTKLQHTRIAISKGIEPLTNLKGSSLKASLSLAKVQKGSGDPSSSFSQPDLQTILSKPWSESDLKAQAILKGWSMDEIVNAVNAGKKEILLDNDEQDYVCVFRVKCGAFGNSAPRWDSLPANQRYGEWIRKEDNTVEFVPAVYPNNWEDETLESRLGPKVNINTDSAGDSYDTEENIGQIYLDNIYTGILSQSWVVLQDSGGSSTAYQVSGTSEKTMADFALTAQVTGLTLERYLFTWNRILEDIPNQDRFKDFLTNRLGFEWAGRDTKFSINNENTRITVSSAADPLEFVSVTLESERTKATLMIPQDISIPLLVKSDDSDSRRLDIYEALVQNFKLRKTNFYGECEKLKLSEVSIKEPLPEKRVMPQSGIAMDQIVLDRMVGGLSPSQPILITGNLENQPGLVKNEIILLSDIVHFENNTRLTTLILSRALTYKFKRDSVTINANIARANHGETKQEVIGSGDQTLRFQQFLLRHKPLTFVSASTESGIKSTLEIRIDENLWQESRSLYDLTYSDNAYVSRINDDGRTLIIFGDGVKGKLPPSGLENIKAQYRVGIGSSGMLKEGQLSLPMTRTLGVRSVTNPLKTSGAADSENIDDARQNAPRTVLTLDRIVSLEDFKNFAQGFAGIGKAEAFSVLFRGSNIVLLTVAGAAGERIDYSSDLYVNLVNAIESFKDPLIQFRVESFNPKLFNVEAKILVSRDRKFEDIKPKVEAVLKDVFSFKMRDFRQAVTIAEIISTIQGVEGMIAVDIAALYEYDPSTDISSQQRYNELIYAKGIPSNNGIMEVVVPSLLVINPDGIKLMEMS